MNKLIHETLDHRLKKLQQSKGRITIRSRKTSQDRRSSQAVVQRQTNSYQRNKKQDEGDKMMSGPPKETLMVHQKVTDVCPLDTEAGDEA